MHDRSVPAGWRPKVGGRVFIFEDGRAATVLAELPGNSFEVEPDFQADGTLERHDEKLVCHLSELGPEHYQG